MNQPRDPDCRGFNNSCSCFMIHAHSVSQLDFSNMKNTNGNNLDLDISFIFLSHQRTVLYHPMVSDIFEEDRKFPHIYTVFWDSDCALR